ncbi:hypothetical protein [Alishewanella tabrizica]|uniref:Uncharacterized protein n=1 Tax=Alishewanella tabrizica TaxID=671278 RepID=A0ABQ2WDW6_9ALTE|nr:hypothetical protein [Alishewanella tabrizica]GGW48426.1 hypothetical protein GCM10008111_00020 [Alishewanella tabrizica]
MDNALLCTGFHRSATSVTTNYLYNAGLRIGSNLMPGGISNPKGHFEDIDLVSLHDSQLKFSGTNWQYHDEVLLKTEPNFLENYVKRRFEADRIWGVKDPRACLFLDEWDKALGENGSYLFVIRHWSSCIESLLHRHSREFAYDLDNKAVSSNLLDFWRDPTLAAKMWLSYNKRILSFTKKNPQKVIIVSQRALFNGAPIIEKINNKFGLTLNNEVKSPFDLTLLRDESNQEIFETLSISLKSQLDAVWLELLALADFSAEDEHPKIYFHPPLESSLFKEYQTALSTVKVTTTSLTEQTTINESEVWLDVLNTIKVDTELVVYLDAATKKDIATDKHLTLLSIIDTKFPTSAVVQLSAAKLLLKLEAYSLALARFKTALSLGVYFPYVDMMIAQCYQALPGHRLEAEFFYNKALKANPKNVSFYIHFARFLSQNSENTRAIAIINQSFEVCGQQPNNIIALCELLEKENRLPEAIDALEKLKNTGDNRGVAFLARLKLQTQYQNGIADYNEITREKIKDKDKLIWLAKVGNQLNIASAENDFISRCVKHWKLLE